jgi:hypothetical protein
MYSDGIYLNPPPLAGQSSGFFGFRLGACQSQNQAHDRCAWIWRTCVFKPRWHPTRHTLGKEVSFSFSTLTHSSAFWSIHIVQKAADNTMVQYWIEYEE